MTEDDSSNQDQTERTANRRTFLKGAIATSTAVVGVPALSSPTVAQSGGTTILGTTAPGAIYQRTSAGWTQIGNDLTGDDGSVTDIVQHGDNIFVGVTTHTSQYEGSGKVYKLDGTNWILVGDNLENNVSTLAVLNSDLYAGTSYGTANLYRYDGPNNWTRVVHHTAWEGVSASYVWDDKLFFGDALYDRYAYYDGNDLTVEQPDSVGSCVYDFVTHDGMVYGGNWNGVLRRRDGNSWPVVADVGFGGLLELETHDGDLYVGQQGGTLYKWDTASSSLTSVHEFPDSVVALLDTEDALYVGIGQNAAEFDDSYRRAAPGEVYRYQDGSATRISDSDQFGDAAQELVNLPLGPDLEIKDVRLVQVVEDTDIERSNNYQEPNPNLVAERNTTALFDVTTEGVEQLPDSVEVEVERTVMTGGGSTQTRTDTFSLSKTDIQSIQNGDDPRAVFHNNTEESSSNDLPVFELDKGNETLQSVTISTAPNNPAVNGDSVTIERGTDFAVQSIPPLRIGIIDVRDPDGGTNYGDPNTGETQQYNATINEIADHFAQQYPASDVRIYRHDTPIWGATDQNGNTVQGNRAAEIDTREARSTLENQLPIAASNTLAGFQGEITEFDATYLVVPGAEGSNPNYYDFHGIAALGFHPINPTNPGQSQPQRSSTGLEGGDPTALLNRPWPNNKAAVVATQEVGHHFEFEPYRGPTFSNQPDHPLAQRRPSGIDFAHADPFSDETPPKVSSVGFDLRDGNFTLGHAPSSGQPVDSQSFMAYEFSPPWYADSRIFQELLDGQFNPQPPESQGTRQQVLMCTFVIQPDGTITTSGWTNCFISPMVNIPDGSFNVSILDAEGEELDAVTTSPGVGYETFGGDEHIVVEDIVPAAVPFPDDAITVEVTLDGTTTRVDPISGLLRTAVATLPAEAFVRNPAERRGALLNKIDAMETQMKNGAFRGAVQKLRNDVRETIQRWIADEYDEGANGHTKKELLELVDDLITRITENTGNGGPGNS